MIGSFERFDNPCPFTCFNRFLDSVIRICRKSEFFRFLNSDSISEVLKVFTLSTFDTLQRFFHFRRFFLFLCFPSLCLEVNLLFHKFSLNLLDEHYQAIRLITHPNSFYLQNLIKYIVSEILLLMKES